MKPFPCAVVTPGVRGGGREVGWDVGEGAGGGGRETWHASRKLMCYEEFFAQAVCLGDACGWRVGFDIVKDIIGV